MGFAEDMQNSFKYTRSLRRKKYYYRDRSFDPKWDMDDDFKMKKIEPHKLLQNKNRNKLYIEEMKEKSKKGLIVGFSVAAGVVYYLAKLFI